MVVAVALPLMIGHGIFGFGKSNSKSKSKSIAHCGLHESPVLLAVTVRLTLADGSPVHGKLDEPLPCVTVTVALPLIVGHGGGGIGMLKSKSKLNSHFGADPQLSPPSVVFVTVMTTLGSVSQAAEPVTTVNAPEARSSGHGTRGGGMEMSKSKSISRAQEPQLSRLVVVTTTVKRGSAHGLVP